MYNVKTIAVEDNSKIVFEDTLVNRNVTPGTVGDTLALVNQASGAGYGTRSFTTDDATATYTATVTPGATAAGRSLDRKSVV